MARSRGYAEGWQGRVVPITDALKAALAAVRHLRGTRVLVATTMRYMHLAEGHKEQAIRLLDGKPAAAPALGVEARLEAVEG